MIQEEKPVVQISTSDLIMSQLRDLKEGQRELSKRMDRLENRVDKIDEKINDMRKEVNDVRKEVYETRREINERLASKIDAAQSHGQIATISSVGVGLSAVSITLGVLYALIFK